MTLSHNAVDSTTRNFVMSVPNNAEAASNENNTLNPDGSKIKPISLLKLLGATAPNLVMANTWLCYTVVVIPQECIKFFPNSSFQSAANGILAFSLTVGQVFLPSIGKWSDNYHNQKNKRKDFMQIAALSSFIGYFLCYFCSKTFDDNFKDMGLVKQTAANAIYGEAQVQFWANCLKAGYFLGMFLTGWGGVICQASVVNGLLSDMLKTDDDKRRSSAVQGLTHMLGMLFGTVMLFFCKSWELTSIYLFYLPLAFVCFSAAYFTCVIHANQAFPDGAETDKEKLDLMKKQNKIADENNSSSYADLEGGAVRRSSKIDQNIIDDNQSTSAGSTSGHSSSSNNTLQLPKTTSEDSNSSNENSTKSTSRHQASMRKRDQRSMYTTVGYRNAGRRSLSDADITANENGHIRDENNNLVLKEDGTPLEFADYTIKMMFNHLMQYHNFYCMFWAETFHNSTVAFFAFEDYLLRDVFAMVDPSIRREATSLLAFMSSVAGIPFAIVAGHWCNNLTNMKRVVYVSCLFQCFCMVLNIALPGMIDMKAYNLLAIILPIGALQGFGVGLHMVSIWALVYHAFATLPSGIGSGEALGIWSLSGMAGLAVGPVICGFLLQVLSISVFNGCSRGFEGLLLGKELYGDPNDPNSAAGKAAAAEAAAAAAEANGQTLDAVAAGADSHYSYLGYLGLAGLMFACIFLKSWFIHKMTEKEDDYYVDSFGEKRKCKVRTESASS